MSRLRFLSPNESELPQLSPLRHVLVSSFADVSGLGKLEVRGDVGSIDVHSLPLGPERALVVVDDDARETRDRLTAEGYRVYDMTATYAALEIVGDDLMRRLTELDLERLPAVGAILRGVSALIERRGPQRYRLFVPAELGHYVAETIDDLVRGLGQ